MQTGNRFSLLSFAAAILFGACFFAAPNARADVIGNAKTAEDFASFRVRRITVHIKGSAEHPELVIPESAMFPIDVILEIRRKRYELLKKVPDGHPPAGALSIVYKVTRRSKGAGKKASFQAKITGQISLREKRKNVLLWGVNVEATESTEKSEKLPPEVIEKLIAGFYKGAFKTLPEAPKYKMVVGAPYRFPQRLTREPLRPPPDTISVGRIMRSIAAGRWEGAPQPVHDITSGGGDPLVQIWNDSEEQLTVCYQGVTDVDVILAPAAKLAFRLAEGNYKIGARTANTSIVPFYNSEHLQPHKTYSIRFALSEEGH